MGDKHSNLLDIGVLLKHFPNLLNSQTDMGSLKHLESQAKDLECYPVYSEEKHLPMSLKLVNERGVILNERKWEY